MIHDAIDAFFTASLGPPFNALFQATICWYGTPASRSVGGIPKISNSVAVSIACEAMPWLRIHRLTYYHALPNIASGLFFL